MEHSRETGVGYAITSRSAKTVSPRLEYNATDWGYSFGGSENESGTSVKGIVFVFSLFFVLILYIVT